MSTFLDICKKVESDSGTVASGSRITSVATATNRQAKIVGFVQDAWEDIQNARTDWKFMRKEITVTLTPEQNWYAPADLGFEDQFGAWTVSNPCYDPFSIWDPALGLADESVIREIPWDQWRAAYGRGVPQLNRPYVYAFGPSDELCFGDTPDKAYKVRCDFTRANQQLVNDADVPAMPEAHHAAIRYRALVKLGNHDESQFLVASGSRDYNAAFAKLVVNQVATGMMGSLGQPIA